MRQKAAFTEIGSSPEQKAFSLIGSLEAIERRIQGSFEYIWGVGFELFEAGGRRSRIWSSFKIRANS